MNHAKVMSIDGATGWAQVIYYPDSSLVDGEPSWFLGPIPFCISKSDGTVLSQSEFEQALSLSIPHSSVALQERARQGGWDVSGLLPDTQVSVDPEAVQIAPTLKVLTLV